MTIAGFGFIPNFLKQQNPALAEGGGTNHVRRGYPPILNNNSPVGNFASAAKFEPNTANRRGSSYADFGAMYSPIPNQKIGMSEGLIRMGGDITGAANQGALAAMNAGTNTYGNIMDYNRARDMEAFQLEEARRADLAERMAAAAANKKENQADLDANLSTLNELDDLVAALQDTNMTGVIAGNVQAYLDKTGLRDFFKGDEKGATRAYFRNRLENFRVDASLAKIAQTKGAISDREMKLFLSPMPTTGSADEAVWIKHLMARRVVLQKILAANGIETPDNPYAHNDGSARSGRDWTVNFSPEQANSILQFLPENDTNDIQQYGD